MKISLSKPSAVVAAAMLGSIVVVLGSAGPASATGTVSLSPSAGTKDSLIDVTTSGGCPVGSDAFLVSITGGAFGATTYNINGYAPLTSVGSSPGSSTGFKVSLSSTIATVAQDNGVTISAGSYSLSVTCLSDDPINPVPVSSFASTLVFLDGTSYITTAPTNSAAPSLSGAVRVGGTAVCSPGTWSGANSFAYSFLRNGAPVRAASSTNTFVLTAADLGASLTCSVVGVNGIGSSSAASSSSVKVAAGAAPVAASKPKIVGKGKVGKKLKANRGTWSPAASYSYTYVWKRSGKVVKQGATATSYKLTKKDKKKKITLTVVVKRAGYTTATATSAAVKVK